MQLDQTKIAIRERGPLETLDLALRVLRHYIGPLLAMMAVGVIPLMLLNHALIGWMADVEYGRLMTWEEHGSVFRYVYNMTFLVFLETQLASVFATRYIGQAVFLERPRYREVLRSVAKTMPALVWWQVVMRGPLLAWMVVLMIDRRSAFTLWEGLALPAIALWAIFMRGLFPFMNEIIVLEGNPMRSKRSETQTISRRSSALHGPASGDLILRWLGAAFVGVLLTLGVYGTFLFMSGVLLNDWMYGPILIKLGVPTSMWLVAAFIAVCRFLSYLDIRIRMEGWEVELRMRAEAARMHGPYVGDAA